MMTYTAIQARGSESVSGSLAVPVLIAGGVAIVIALLVYLVRRRLTTPDRQAVIRAGQQWDQMTRDLATLPSPPDNLVDAVERRRRVLLEACEADGTPRLAVRLSHSSVWGGFVDATETSILSRVRADVDYATRRTDWKDRFAADESAIRATLTEVEQSAPKWFLTADRDRLQALVDRIRDDIDEIVHGVHDGSLDPYTGSRQFGLVRDALPGDVKGVAERAARTLPPDRRKRLRAAASRRANEPAMWAGTVGGVGVMSDSGSGCGDAGGGFSGGDFGGGGFGGGGDGGGGGTSC
jgi:hypothetical protein